MYVAGSSSSDTVDRQYIALALDEVSGGIGFTWWTRPRPTAEEADSAAVADRNMMVPSSTDCRVHASLCADNALIVGAYVTGSYTLDDTAAVPGYKGSRPGFFALSVGNSSLTDSLYAALASCTSTYCSSPNWAFPDACKEGAPVCFIFYVVSSSPTTSYLELGYSYFNSCYPYTNYQNGYRETQIGSTVFNLDSDLSAGDCLHF